MSKLTTQDESQMSSLSLRYFRVRGEDRQENFMVNIIMIKEIVKVDIDQIVEIGEYHSVIEYNMGKIIEIVLGIIRTIKNDFRRGSLEGI